MPKDEYKKSKPMYKDDDKKSKKDALKQLIKKMKG
jgi:hypothetical protein